MGDTSSTVTALSGFLTSIGTVFTSATGWIGTIVGVIMDTPVLLVPIALGFGFTAIEMFNALRR